MSVKTALLRFTQTLSTRLVVLTVLWVGFMIASIAYTMTLSWRVEESGHLLALAESVNAQVYRVSLTTSSRFGSEDFAHELGAIRSAVNALDKNEWIAGYGGRSVERIRRSIDLIQQDWEMKLEPMLLATRDLATPLDVKVIESFGEGVLTLNRLVVEGRTGLMWQMRSIQILLIFLALASLFVIVYVLNRWVIQPTDLLLGSLKRLTLGELSTRVALTGSSEYERIGVGFNQMAERMQDLVENLEGNVAEKTKAIEEQNRNLAQLYALTSYFGESHTVDEMSEDFAVHLMQFTEAQGCAILLTDENSAQFQFVASDNLPQSIFAKLARQPMLREELAAFDTTGHPVRFTRGSDFVRALQIDGQATPGESDPVCGYLFHIRNGNKILGVFVLYYEEDVTLSEPRMRLYESFGSHLGIAVDNRRLIDRDQQHAVVQERNLMAQGLHDSIAQSLSFLNLQVQFLESGLKSGDTAFVNDTVAQIKEGVQQSYEDVRELLLNFRERIHAESFEQAIAMAVGRFEAQTHVKVQTVLHEKGQALTDRQKLQVTFIVQEALANVRKHSKATEARIDVENGADFTITISDNGTGIDPKLVEERKQRHVGLNIMRERSERIGAILWIGTVSPKLYPSGTSVRLTIPAARR